MTKKPQSYFVKKREFDGYDKDNSRRIALGSERTARKQEASDLRSVNWVPNVSGWRLTPTGIELGSVNAGLFPPGTITFADIQNIATARLLGRTTAGSGTIEELSAATVKTLLAIVSTDLSDFTEAAQDAVGAALVDTATIDFTYNDPANTITADIIAAYRRKTLFDYFADVGNIGTGEDDLFSSTIAAGQLANNGEKIETEYAGTFVTSAGTATRQLRIYFGGTLIFDTGALLITGATAWTVYATVIRVSASVVRAMVSLTTQGASLAAYTSYTEVTALTLANTQVMKITGEAAGVGAATNDIVAKMGSLQWLAAA